MRTAKFLLAAACVLALAQPLPAGHFNRGTDLWIDQLFSESNAEADQAALHLFTDATLSLAVLMENRESRELFRGGFLSHPTMSILRDSQPSIGMVCLYLIEAIRCGDLFFGYDYYPIHEGWAMVPREKREKVAHENAVKAYERWWKKMEGMEDEELMEYFYKVSPLDGTDMWWMPSSGGWRLVRKYK